MQLFKKRRMTIAERRIHILLHDDRRMRSLRLAAMDEKYRQERQIRTRPQRSSSRMSLRDLAIILASMCVSFSFVMCRPMRSFAELADTDLVRLADILAPRGPMPVSKSTWWAGVKSGRYPQPVKLGSHITAWNVGDIRRLLATGTGPARVGRPAVRPAA